MQFFFMSLNLLMSFNFTLMNHPLAMGLILLIQTILISMITGFMLQTFWFSYILFLILLGGMLVLFIYMTSLASNELFSFSMKSLLMNFIILTFMMMLMILYIPYNNFLNLDMSQFYNYTLYTENNIELLKLYNFPTMNLTLMLVSYLFLTLIIVVKITNISQGPLRQFN
uniref:NADH-ubiquinone oxidoreductase chain 6 n=1 Tax=Neochauliodes punctatolosus TaxID=1204440 RepID=K4GK52_NEOPN|nr:NADH dehydrogenase subunit 6 [Neochauliodes punctatolosus]AFN10585.1 NADH dehydrogenase subunit 6 [Neochauliodes punctatolosus]